MASPYLTLATDGADLGANMAQITALTSVASSGDRRSVTETRYSGGWFTYNGVNRVQYPRTLLDTDTFPTRTGSVINVNTDAGFRAALTTAQPGDWIVVDNTVTYVGNYYGAFPVKNGDATPGGNNVIVVISKAIYDGYSGGTFSVCPQKKRIAPTDVANLAFFKSTNSLGAFMITGATKGWRFVGLRFEPDTSVPVVSHMVSAGNPDNALQSNLSQCPSNIGFDRCYFDGHATGEIRHATELHCKSGFIIDSYYGDNLHVTSFTDSQCLTMYNGPGPFRVVNNRVCGQIENVIIGGSTSTCGMPADIEFRYNVFTRPTSTKGVWGTKCGFEIKKTQFCLVEGNIVENTWPDRQIGAGFLIKSESYGDGAVIGYSQDILLRWNLVRNVAAALTFTSQSPPVGGTEPALPINRAISYSNLYIVGGGIFDASQNPMVGMYVSQNCGIIHDTYVGAGTILSIGVPSPTVCSGFIISDCIFPATNYGLKSGGTLEGTDTIAIVTAAGGTVSKDVFTGRSSGTYPAGHYFPANEAAIQYTDSAAKDYSLLGTSQSGGGTVTPVATRLRIRTQPSGGASGSALPTQPVIEILDQFGNVFSSTATVTATSDSGSVSETGNTKAAVAGVATFTALTPTAASTTPTTWTFTSPGLTSVTSSSTSVTVAIASRVATALSIVTQPAGSTSGVALTQQPIVRVVDQYGDPITSTATITANVVSTGPVSFTAGTTAVASAGLATFTTLTAVTPSEYNAAVNFTSPGLTSAQSNYFVVTVVAVPIPTPTPEEPPPSEPPITPTTDPVPASLVVTREPGPAGKLYSRKKFPIQPIVEAHDETGALMTTFNGHLTAFLGDGQAGTLIGGVTVAAVGGIGRWVNLGVSGATGPVELSFIDGPYDGSV